ncbi:right-handed parallel beta-helix repeat-containing protein [Algibacter lectus]|uniref:Right handed beta helix domain-containing protein n=1 Tax=Algibacter lectus TaxID=221126 RepID=A0A4V3HHB8_9FLAO|nr:right-handed parallel beta-helix repeat-containing protein [Algibacter lectus]MWW24987.1 hypothetical protein [Algibacter lectus]TDY64601.1 hypothetical protein DFQ06_1513 [Algibacter lectus]
MSKLINTSSVLKNSMFLFGMCFLLSITASAQIKVNSLSELIPYLSQNEVHVKMTPGVYSITAADVKNGLYPKSSFVGKECKVLLLFEGSKSTYDFSGVTIKVDTKVFQSYGNIRINEIQIVGNNNVLKNLTLIDDGSVYDGPTKGALNVCIDGKENLVEGFYVAAKGSFPYGYGDAFGKGGKNVIRHQKHSSCLIRGESNHLKNSTFIHRSYGHCLFMQAASNPTIEGCYVEGEMRSTDDMLLEKGTGSPADKVDFMTVWGYELPKGYMLSTGEAGIRAYNAGETIIDGKLIKRGTSNPTILNCTVKNMRTGVTLAHATGKKYVENCTVIGSENGFSLGSGDVINCRADCSYGPVYSSTYENDKNFNADITIIPASNPYMNGSGNVAYIGGRGHNITLRGSNEGVEHGLQIKVGGLKNNIRLLNGNFPHQNDFKGSDFEINNLTDYPLYLSNKSLGVTGRTSGTIEDLGTNNTIQSK